MGALQLQILEPANGTTLAGTGAVRLRGALNSLAPAPLFYKWYSSLAADPLPFPAGGHFDFTTTLRVGTHVLTFSAKDVPGDDAASVAAVRHGGFAGGPPTPTNPGGCLINVLLAAVHTPAAGATLSKASSTLRAVAPSLWGKPSPTPPPTFVLNDDYHAINHVRFIWILTPVGTPPGPASPRLTLTPAQTTFELDGSTPLARYQGPLPPALGTGNHTLILRVEDLQNPATGHEASVNVVLTA